MMEGRWKHEILSQLDQHASSYDFPVLDNIYYQHAVIRLSAFRSPEEWLVTFQWIAVFQERSLMDTVFAYGNKIPNPGLQFGDEDMIAAPTSELFWDEHGGFGLDKFDFELLIRGRSFHFTPTVEDYRHAGIDPYANDSAAVQILRLLTWKIPNELFMEDRLLLDACSRQGAHLENLLQLDEWHDPNITQGEIPSQSPCFQSLAEALAQGDPTFYKCPSELINTHWSNWIR
jgi:hypothetical protein